MRRVGLVLLAASALAAASAPAVTTAARAAPYGYAQAQANFDGNLNFETRQLVQIWLIAGGYSNVVPADNFTTHVFKAIQKFESDNGFDPNGRIDKTEAERLIAIANEKFGVWGLRKVVFPGRGATVWVPFGLDLEAKANGSGLHYKDRQGRLALDFVSVADRTVEAVYRGMIGDKQRDGWTIYYAPLKADEGWFALSAKAPDGTDHYYRYHQDGDAVTGFALEWNNAVENLNAERIAVLDSAVLAASMKGAPFVDPPHTGAVARSEPNPQPAARPVDPTPAPRPSPAPEKKEGFSTGTGFFVSDNGYLVTNAHVVADCTQIMVKLDDGSTHEAARTATDTTNDLAILKLDVTPKRVVPLRLGTRLGEGVEAFGFPHADMLSSNGNFTTGNVTALAGMGDDTRYLQISAPVQAGNSGGPLLDGSGNLVGVVSMKLNAVKVAAATDDFMQNVNFAVKSAIVANFLDSNRVEYKMGMAGKAMEPADLADQARAMSGFVVCR